MLLSHLRVRPFVITVSNPHQGKRNDEVFFLLAPEMRTPPRHRRIGFGQETLSTEADQALKAPERRRDRQCASTFRRRVGLIDIVCVDNRQRGRLLDLLFYKLEGEGTSLFALMDAAREPRVLQAVVESGLDHECLFAGDLDPAMRAAAPYIVRLVHGSLACERLIVESWGRQWGIFVSARVGLRMVRQHLRTFLRVQTEDRRKLLFRYYDPRVLRTFLPTCDFGQLWQIFGPIQRFDMEAPDSGQLLRFRVIPEPGPSFKLRTWTYGLSAEEHAVDDHGPS
jgi:hypothetical protein